MHGFPECWLAWRYQLPALAAAGFRAVAPDLRGYGGSDKPRGAAAYRIDLLARDAAELIVALGHERADLVGHDWGAHIAWHVAMWDPRRVRRLAILNVPHPERMRRGLRTLRQLRKSWYMLFFQLPVLPECSCRRGGCGALSGTRRRAGRPTTTRSSRRWVLPRAIALRRATTTA